ncbi:MAG: hypothetical protein RLZZ292_1272 [Bacteroidota bacterium]
MYYNDLYSYARGILKNKENVEDCIQDFFIHLWKNKAKTTPKSSVKILLLGILRNFTLDYQRKINTRNRILPLFLQETPHFELSPEAQFLEQEQLTIQQKNVLQLLHQALNAQQREAIFLRYYHDFSIAQVAEVMQLSYDATAKYLSRAATTLSKQKETYQNMELKAIVGLLFWLNLPF